MVNCVLITLGIIVLIFIDVIRPRVVLTIAIMLIIYIKYRENKHTPEMVYPHHLEEIQLLYNNAHIILYVDNNHKIHTTLNGCHGEWTNSDDVKTGVDSGLNQMSNAYQGDNDTRRGRKFKPEKKNNIPKDKDTNNNNVNNNVNKNEADKKKPLSAAARQAYAWRLRKLAANGLLGHADDPSPEELEDAFAEMALEKRLLVTSEESEYAFDGKNYFFRLRDRYVCLAPNCDISYSGDSLVSVGTAVADVVRSGPGWLVTRGVGAYTDVARFFMEEVHNPYHMYNHSPSKQLVDLHAYSELRSAFPGAMKNHHIGAYQAFIDKKLVPVGMPSDLALDAIRFMSQCSDAQRAYQWSDEATRLKTGDPTSLGQYDIQDTSICADLGITHSYDGPVVLDSVTCVIPDTYKMKRNFHMVASGGSCEYERAYDPLKGWENEPIKYPTFDTIKVDGLTAHNSYYNTQFCRFVGEKVEPFLLYDVNGINATKAMKRLIGAREHENYLTSRQYRTLRCMLDSGRVCYVDKYLPTLRTKFYGQSVTIGEEGHLGRYHMYSRLDMPPESQELVQREAAQNNMYPDFKIGLDAELQGHQYVANMYLNLLDSVGYDGVADYVARTTDNLLTTCHWAYYRAFEEAMTLFDPCVSREFCANEIPHVKRELRKAYVDGELLHYDEGIMVDKCKAKVKKEFAKAGKVPRLFVNYGSGCMYANEIPEYVKTCLDSDIEDPVGDGVDDVSRCAGQRIAGQRSFRLGHLTYEIFIMAKPKVDDLDKVFLRAIDAMNTPNHLFFAIYSDDMIMTGNWGGEQLAANIDISSCDSSQGPLAFSIVGAMMGKFNEDRAHGLLKQCMRPILVQNPDNMAEKFTLNFHGPFEGSGTVLTTVLNHVASYGIAHGIAKMMSSLGDDVKPSDGQLRCIIKRGASFAGHEVTADLCGAVGGVVIEKLQFLKRSPVDTNCGWKATLNLGCIFRALGTVEGDLNHIRLGLEVKDFRRLDWQSKMDTFLAGVLRGLKHEPSCLILKALRERFLPISHGCSAQPGDIANVPWKNPELLYADNGGAIVNEESLGRRYGWHASEVDKLINQILIIKVGDVAVSTACSMMYNIDYGSSLR